MARIKRSHWVTALASAALTISLVLPSAAAAKSLYELRIGDSASIQSAIAPTLFAGRSCVEVLPRTRGDGVERTHAGATELVAGRRYWTMILFRGERRRADELKPALVLRDLATGRAVRIEAEYVYGSRIGAYTTDATLRFPHPGAWSVAIDDGAGHAFELSDGRVFSTAESPAGRPLSAAELKAAPLQVEKLDPPSCPTTASTAAGGTDSGSVGWQIAIAIAAGAGIGVRVLRRLRPQRLGTLVGHGAPKVPNGRGQPRP